MAAAGILYHAEQRRAEKARKLPITSICAMQAATLSLLLANELAGEAIAACRAIDKAALVAVMDRGGNLVALQRGDNVGSHNTAEAQREAVTALSTKTRTGLLAERARTDPSSQNLNTVGELLLLGGGNRTSLNNSRGFPGMVQAVDPA